MPRTDEYEGMIAEATAITSSDGATIEAYFARPLTGTPVGSVVLFHHRPGWDEWYREATRRFAHHGYNAICPNLYHRYGHGEPDDVAAKVRAEGDVPDETVVQDGKASIAFLRALPSSNGRVALMGTCSGGRHAYLTACHTEGAAAPDAVVDCWGGRIVMAPDDLSDRYPVAPIDLTPQLPCPVLGLFGNDDGAPSPAEVDAHEEALRAAGKTYEFHRYDGAGHGFFYYDRPAAYRAEAALDGWARIWDFLRPRLLES
jgi:carboxymethylenebutenolidase